jgi:hypothetical protein
VTPAVRHRLAVAGIGLGIAICGARESDGKNVKMTTVARFVTCAVCKRKTEERRQAAKDRMPKFDGQFGQGEKR